MTEPSSASASKQEPGCASARLAARAADHLTLAALTSRHRLGSRVLAIAWRIGGPDVYLHLGTPLAPRGIVQELQGASFRSSPGAPVATRSSKIVGSHHGRRVPARIPRPITCDELLEV